MKKNLYIHGSFMTDNYGDFLLYYVVRKIVDRYKDKYNIYSSDVHRSYDNYCDVERKSKIFAIKNSDIVIFAGGGYFGEPDKRKILWNIRCIFKHLLPAYLISKRKIPYAIIGVETGPLKFGISRILLKSICNNASLISIRNNESKRFLESIGVNKKIMMNPDWIIGIERDILFDKKYDLDTRVKDGCRKILIHLTTKPNEGKENVINDLIKFQQENRDVYYLLVCDQKRYTQEKRVQELYDRFDKERTIINKYDGPWKLTKLIDYCDAVLTDKLHVGIVATKLNKEVVSVANHSKSVKFYRLINREEWTNYMSKVTPNETYNKLNNLSFKPIVIDEQLFNQAKNNEILLNDFLKNRCLNES